MSNKNDAVEPEDIDVIKSEDKTSKEEVEFIEAESTETTLEELDAVQKELEKVKEAYLRAKAEEDNVRRRSEKEITNSRKFAVENFAKEMLNVRDSLKIASDVTFPEEVDEQVSNLLEGVQITLKQLDAAFSRSALHEIVPEKGDKLDPNVHQAMSQVDSEEIDSGCVVQVVQSGFKLHDRVLRPAMVMVAK